MRTAAEEEKTIEMRGGTDPGAMRVTGQLIRPTGKEDGLLAAGLRGLPRIFSLPLLFGSLLRFISHRSRIHFSFPLGMLHGILTSPLGGCLVEGVPISLVLARDIRHQRVVRVGVRQQRAHGQQNLRDRQRR